jgi:hypothetical protein
MKSTHRKRRASERGAALVETALMFPLFITITFAGFYAYNLGRAGIEIHTGARQEAWTYAMSNCGNNGQSESEALPPQGPVSSGRTTGGLSTSTPITHDPNSTSFSQELSGTMGSGQLAGAGQFVITIIDGFFNEIQGLFPNPKGSTNTQTEAVNYRIPAYGSASGPGFVDRAGSASGAGGGLSKNLKNNVVVFCNEKAQNGNFPWLDALAAAADAIIIAMAPSPDI